MVIVGNFNGLSNGKSSSVSNLIFITSLAYLNPLPPLLALKELQNYKWNYFCVRHKIGANATNILKLLFFIINLHFVTSHQLSTSRKLNLPLTSSVYFVFFPQEMQKRLKQTKVYHAFSHRPLNVPAARTIFCSVYVIATTCFN